MILTTGLKGTYRQSVKRVYDPSDFPECQVPSCWEAADYSRFRLGSPVRVVGWYVNSLVGYAIVETRYVYQFNPTNAKRIAGINSRLFFDPEDFLSPHPSGINFLMCDDSFLFIKSSVYGSL